MKTKMPKPDQAVQKRIQLRINESTDPGLIDNLKRVGERNEASFVRAILLDWFASHQ